MSEAKPCLRISFGPSDIPEAEPKQGSEEPILPVTELEAEKSTSKILRALLAKAESERDEARATKDMHKERQEEAWAEVAALRAELAAADQNLKTMLQAAGEEAERQLATAREEIAKLREMRAPTTPTVEMVRLRQSNQNLMMLYANAIGECRKINKAIHRVLRGRNNAVKQLAAEKARADRAEERVKELEVEVERRKTFNKTGFRLLKEKCKQLHSVTYCQDDRCNLGPHHHAVERKEHPPDGVSYSKLIHYGSEIGCAECAILAARARKEGGSNA